MLQKTISVPVPIYYFIESAIRLYPHGADTLAVSKGVTAVSEGKTLWVYGEDQFLSELPFEPDHLSISKSGNFVAAVDSNQIHILHSKDSAKRQPFFSLIFDTAAPIVGIFSTTYYGSNWIVIRSTDVIVIQNRKAITHRLETECVGGSFKTKQRLLTVIDPELRIKNFKLEHSALTELTVENQPHYPGLGWRKVRHSVKKTMCAISDTEIKVIPPDTSAPAFKIERLRPTQSRPSTLLTHAEFSSDGHWLWVSDEGGTLRAFESKSGKLVASYSVPVDPGDIADPIPWFQPHDDAVIFPYQGNCHQIVLKSNTPKSVQGLGSLHSRHPQDL